AYLFYNIFYVQPGMEKWQQAYFAKMGLGTPPPSSPMQNMFGSGFGLIFSIAYPSALLIVMLLPMVGAAFAGKRTLPEPQDYDDRRPPPPPGQGDTGSTHGLEI